MARGGHHALLVVPYWAQCDADMYTEQALRERIKVREHPTVTGELQIW